MADDKAESKLHELACRLAVEALDADSHDFERILRAELKPLLDAAYVALVYDSAHDACDSECPMRKLAAELKHWRKE